MQRNIVINVAGNAVRIVLGSQFAVVKEACSLFLLSFLSLRVVIWHFEIKLEIVVIFLIFFRSN